MDGLIDCTGTPLHVCAKKNLARPIRMLVDSGADVNAKHGNDDTAAAAAAVVVVVVVV
jgi:hypothetical protein